MNESREIRGQQQRSNGQLGKIQTSFFLRQATIMAWCLLVRGARREADATLVLVLLLPYHELTNSTP